MKIFDPRARAEHEATTLHLERVFASASVACENTRPMFRRATIETYESHLRELIYQLDTYMLGLPDERIVVNERWPADWWQAVKERWLPWWLLQFWPVKYRELKIDEQKYKAVCPHLDGPRTGECVKFMYNASVAVDDMED